MTMRPDGLNLGKFVAIPAIWLLASLPGPTLLRADVVVLRDGARVSGKVTEKPTHVEVAGEGALRTYLNEEVERILRSPQEVLGGAEQAFEEAKAQYQAARTLADPGRQDAALKEALSQVKSARAAFASARDLFPEDRYANLDDKIVQIMQFIRLVRGSMHSESSAAALAGAPLPGGTLDSPGAFVAGRDAVAILLDASKRADPDRRASAAQAFRAARKSSGGRNDLVTASMLFLSRSDAEWKLSGAGAGAMQDYFNRGWLKDASGLSPAGHLEAAGYLASRKNEFGGGAEAAALFGLAHLASSPAGPEREKAAATLGVVVRNGWVGTLEGFALRDLGGWIATGDYDLAALAFVREYRSIDTPSVRFVWSYALLRLVQEKKRGFDRPVSALGTIQAADAPLREHAAALARSIKAVAVCGVCLGQGKLRCTNCHGQKETRFLCARCKGKGHTVSSLGAKLVCPDCRGTGVERIVRCEKCKDGWNACKQCDGKKHEPPELEEICAASACQLCEGRGTPFSRVLVPCSGCRGLGLVLVPKADPSKVLR